MATLFCLNLALRRAGSVSDRSSNAPVADAPGSPGSASSSLAEAEQVIADTDRVSRSQRPRTHNTLPVDIRPGCRAGIGQDVGIALASQPGVDAFDAVIAGQADVTG